MPFLLFSLPFLHCEDSTQIGMNLVSYSLHRCVESCTDDGKSRKGVSNGMVDHRNPQANQTDLETAEESTRTAAM